MSESFDLADPDHFTAGTVGPAGERVFYLQGRESGALVTLKCEKEQVGALADYLARLLARLPAVEEDLPDALDLVEPVDAAWSVASLGVGYDRQRDRILIVATEQVADEGGEEAGDRPAGGEEAGGEAAGGEEAATARFRITRAQAAAFVGQGRALLRAGRPICPICSQPKDPGGHICARSNGHVVR